MSWYVCKFQKYSRTLTFLSFFFSNQIVEGLKRFASDVINSENAILLCCVCVVCVCVYVCVCVCVCMCVCVPQALTSKRLRAVSERL